MIRTIMLTHRYADAIPSTIACLFFRMAGIYVVENYLDSATDLREELNEFGIAPSENLACFCDAEIVLMSDKSDKERIYKTDSDMVVKIFYGEASDNQKDGTDTEWLINQILDELSLRGLLKENQKFDLDKVADVFSSEDYVNTTMLTKYFFTSQDSDWIDEMLLKYKSIVRNLQKSYKDNKVCPHVEFALLNTAYEVNLYCKRCERPPIYSYKEIIDMANELKSISGSLLERSIELLLAQVELNLARDRATAYYRMSELCRNDKNVNSYIFFLKGNYWLSEENYERATKYYKNAIIRFPQYYRAWYQLGICLYNQGETEKAREAFLTVKKILTERFENNVLRPMEVEYLYNACVYCGEIQESYAAFSGALVYYGFAKRVWDSLESSLFIQYLGRINFVVKRIKNEFDIFELEKRIQRCKEYLGV